MTCSPSTPDRTCPVPPRPSVRYLARPRSAAAPRRPARGPDRRIGRAAGAGERGRLQPRPPRRPSRQRARAGRRRADRRAPGPRAGPGRVPCAGRATPSAGATRCRPTVRRGSSCSRQASPVGDGRRSISARSSGRELRRLRAGRAAWRSAAMREPRAAGGPAPTGGDDPGGLAAGRPDRPVPRDGPWPVSRPSATRAVDRRRRPRHGSTLEASRTARRRRSGRPGRPAAGISAASAPAQPAGRPAPGARPARSRCSAAGPRRTSRTPRHAPGGPRPPGRRRGGRRTRHPSQHARLPGPADRGARRLEPRRPRPAAGPVDRGQTCAN